MTPLTLVHTLISLVGIVSGFVVIFGLQGGKRLDGWTAVFLVTTVLTSVTGFFFPFFQLLPSHILGIISLVVLVPAIYGRYAGHLAGPWRWIYVLGAVMAQYFNCFVLVVQLYRRVPALAALAPTQTEAPFKVTQLVVLVVFGVLAVRALKGFRVESLGAV